jgi:hypothetical protein
MNIASQESVFVGFSNAGDAQLSRKIRRRSAAEYLYGQICEATGPALECL